MEYQETYQGQQIIVSTAQGATGAWTSVAEFVVAGQTVSLAGGPEEAYASEEEARRAALSVAAAEIDRTRATRGKP
jgi:hypothetical protein